MLPNEIMWFINEIKYISSQQVSSCDRVMSIVLILSALYESTGLNVMKLAKDDPCINLNRSC